jgi:hypothetical protein
VTRQFLREPDLFPARIAGETWGDERRDLELAGERFRIDGLSPLQVEGLAERFGARLHECSGDIKPAATLHVFRAPASDFIEFDTRGWEYWADLRWSESGFALTGLHVMARAEERRAGMWTPIETAAEFAGIIENVLRPMLAAWLLEHGGLLVHSAAVDGYLFAGHSGAGKSTIAKLGLEAGLPVLSDDLNALVACGRRAEHTPHPPAAPSPLAEGRRQHEAHPSDEASSHPVDCFELAPLPFTGDLEEWDTSKEPTALRAVLALEKGDAESVEPMTLAQAVSLLVRCAPYVNQDPHRMPLLLERAAAVAASVQRGKVTFRLDGHVWPILDVGLNVG